MRDRAMTTLVAIVTVAMIAGVVTLSALSKPTGDLIAVFAAAVLPIITAYVASGHAKVDNVEKQVNGRLSRLIELLAKAQPVDEKDEASG